MWLKILFVLVLTSHVMMYFQNDYHINPHHITVTWFNKDWFKDFKVITFKHNRTATAFNMSINLERDLSNHLTGAVTGFKFLSNEYRPFPLDFKFNFCQALLQDTFGLGTLVLQHSNTTLCPLKRGYYWVANFMFDESKFPPYMPAGKYKVSVQALDKSAHIVDLDLFAECIPIEHYRYKF